MIYRLGDIVRKTKSVPYEYTTIPTKSKVYNDLNQFVSEFNSGTSFRKFINDEQIVYTRQIRRPKGGGATNYCEHIKTKEWNSGDLQRRQNIPYKTGIGFDGWYTDYGGGPSWAAAIHAETLNKAGLLLGEVIGRARLENNWKAYAGDAIVRNQPDLTALSVPNFLIELGQLKQLFHLWTTNLTLAKNLAGTHLNYKFGWKPTIGDVKNVIEVFTKVRQKLADFNRSVGTKVTKSYTNDTITVFRSGDFISSLETSSKVVWTAVLSGKVKTHIRYIPQPIKMTGKVGETLDIFADALGFELNPGIVWEAIPFSFVVDWFLNVGSWLEQFKVDTFQLPIVLDDVGVHYKETYTVSSQLILNYNSAVSQPTVWDPWFTQRSYFNRMPVDPSEVMRELKWKRPKTGQWELLVSLATVLGPKFGPTLKLFA